jgi:uncharacterized protein YndB with AHSA1/START domain
MTMPVTNETRSIVVEHLFDHPLAIVWRALTESALIEGWLMRNDFRPEVGRRFTFLTQAQPGFDGVVQCRVLEIDPLHRIRFTQKGGDLETIVTWTLTDLGGGRTQLRIDHDGFGPGSEFAYDMLKDGWEKKMQPRLGAILAGLER